MNIEQHIIASTIAAVKELYHQDLPENQVSLQDTRTEFEGQITIVVFPIVRFSKKSPEVTAADLGEYLVQHIPEIRTFNVIKGFLNLSIADAYWLNLFNTSLLDPSFAAIKPNGKKVMVEYSSPNTNKPLHLGHVRNNLLGYSVAELLKADGYEVIKVNLVNDRGIHICKSMLAWQKWGNGETPESALLKGDHLVGKYYVIFDKEYKKEIDTLKLEGQTEEEAKKNAPLIKEAQKMLLDWEAGVPEVIDLWKKMNGWVYAGFDVSYKNLGVDFDKYYYESNTYLLGKDTVDEGLEKGIFFKKPDGSVWIDLTEDGLDQKLVLRADGTSVYITQDLGTAQMKYDDFKMDESIYVVGNEQDYHFKVLFLILEKLGKSWAKGLHHLSYGMVDLPSGKMKSREGTVVDADDLVAEMIETARAKTEILGKVNDFEEKEKKELFYNIGLGALKYFLLKVEPKKRLLFDPSESIDFQGNTGPFIQYTHARIKSLLSKADYDFSAKGVSDASITGTELEMIMLLAKYPAEIASAAKAYSPATLANYLYEVAKLFNKFYHETPPIIKEENETVKLYRLNLSFVTADVLKRGMRILGITVPERM
ncbi:arginine--tRNA ligase [Pedobacter heparinus]|uniref:Arginine--tRNA ligase n=1 Tax=Pedobacter heparinus (strain ATCC 13125 / DSM 2366 / CIP 104194 / JCM 7457 / NBRC 12017 / NCIMB 9290 / NRRL B-14731 / HIM 762-3) TaxID=485917 RepID=C6XYP0_PEDHD|nr:arginine--tRNA ligase [Pedobacter heparinus]ACU04522.1 arginyl-tRNA synthetase [Pedobacter heparinus DSM 2366]